MANELEVTVEKTVVLKMSGEYAEKLEKSLSRMLDEVADMAHARRTPLVNAGVVDTLVAALTALGTARQK
jgi:hypothetical protein